jgi:hypothetical protein
MEVINGKITFFKMKMFGRIIEIHLWLTEDCSTKIRDKALLKLQVWNKNYLDLLKEYKKEIFKLK